VGFCLLFFCFYYFDFECRIVEIGYFVFLYACCCGVVMMIVCLFVEYVFLFGIE